MKAETSDPLTELWYEDGVQLWRCKVCLALQTDGHRAACPIGAFVEQLLAIAGLVNVYHNDGTTLTAAETLKAIADVLGSPL